ncbi:acetyl-CoA synthetase-like protein [Corynespora cassiicola Philippines]|uniref:Acetyl-CoA synthetase-like protein n=1 Tax=Corynespora cassiicola Philippines TaxID=1448308 RepID=A0A2T2P3I1_CORCC|nr:acetyl-CoA synthetase-like protein [Corynespora cassiicola Philippines]
MPDDLYQRAISSSEAVISTAEPSSKLELTLRSVWAHVLNLPEQQVALDRSFLSLGGDSISAMQVMGQCRKKGIGLGVQEILRSRSIPQLASAVTEIKGHEEVKEEIDVPFDLTPIQSLWFQLPNQGHGHFNQSFYLRVTQPTTAQGFRSAVEKLVSRHSMLRSRFCQTESGWQQRITEDIANSYRFRHEKVSSKTEIDRMIENSQKVLNHSNGPVFAADLFELGNEQHAFVVGHHLVIDLVTWRLLLEELEEILKGGSLLPPALPFQRWAQLQREHAATLNLEKVLPRANIPPLNFSYWGIQHSDNTYGNAGHGSFDLDEDITSTFLTKCHKSLRTEPVEVLLACLLHSWTCVFEDRSVPAIFNEGHGREPWNKEIDVSRTVGWFTTLYPIFVESSENPIDTVRKVKDFRRQIPANGRPYFARRCLTADGREYFKDHWPMEISFNYLGQYQQLERADALLQPLESMAGETREAGGTADVGHDAPRFALFEISAIVFKGRLKFAFTYNRHMKHQGKIQQWISECEQLFPQVVNSLATQPLQPTISDFPLLSLTEDRFQSMIKRLERLGVASAEIDDAFPCSNMQEGLLLSQNKDAGFYAAVTVHELKLARGNPDWNQLAEAWRRVVNRHPMLRTIFLENIGDEEGLYDQVVLRNVEANVVHFECLDEKDMLSILERQRAVSYDNGRSPPHRFTICTTPTQRVFCCLEISHAIMDGHSMSIIQSDLRKAYASTLLGDGPLYSDYISYLTEQPHQESLAYWKSYLQGSEICSFPILNDGVALEKHLRSIRLDFGNLSVTDLQRFCNRHGITLSNIFHTAWALTLSLYVGTKDVTFGYLTSARDSEEIHGVEEMIGPLINTIVCRIKLSGTSQCLLDVLQNVQKDYMEALPYRHTSLAEIQHALELNGASLFNTALSYRKLPSESSADDSNTKLVEVCPIYDPTEYPISVNIEVSDEAAMVDLDYWTDHVSDGQASNVANTFIRALENIVFNAEQSLATLDHVSRRHLKQIQDWNSVPETINECVHHRFESWVLSQPDAPAIRGFDGDYTYAELGRVTERLAHYLVELGVGPEVFVPTCFDKSTFAVIAMLAVLKAGGAAVPLDANHPKPALESRVEDSDAQVVLTTAVRSELFEDIVPDVVIVDSVLLDDLVDNNDGPACTTVQPRNPAFVIFTSGSTGRPKGVVLEHAAMVTSAYAHGSHLKIGPGARFLQFASYTFDNSLEEMFTTLQRGGCVCVPSEDQRMNHLADVIAELDANFMDLTPTVASLLNPTDVPTIKDLALGGEALTKAVLDQWCPYVHVHGQYGPSEASINSAYKDFKHSGDATNIGRAVGSVSWIVDPDDYNKLAPIGCKGELLLEGPILARGYLKDPEKTNAVFIKDPEWAQLHGKIGRRMYCTGDLVHYTSEGELMYLGRKDSQVKLNGQRIELGEIEHHMKISLPDEAHSAVELVKFTGTVATKALVGFICMPDSVSDTTSAIGDMTDAVRAIAKDIEKALSHALPSYYVPSMFLPVTRMPMTTSGKLDRKVLRALAVAVPEEQRNTYRLADKSGRAPSGFAEVTLARLWATLLNRGPESIGADDSFFRLGGDSIGAMRLVTASRKEGLALAVSNIFAHPKLVDMAATAVVLSSDETLVQSVTDTLPFELIPDGLRRHIIDFASAECRVFPDSIEDIYPCSRLQEGLIALSTTEPGAYVAETIYRLPQDINLERFKHSWNQVIALEPILRTRIVFTEDCGFLQVVVREEPTWHLMDDLRDINEEHRQLPARHGGPLVNYALVGQRSSSPFFVWTAHHAVYDGWSLPSILSKVEAYYNQTSPEPQPTVPYTRFIKHLSTIDEKQSDDFWISTFEDIAAPQFPQLPTPDFKIQASSQLLHSLAIARRPGMETTMPSMIRAAWALLLASYSGSDDVFWGETNSGREVPVPDIEDIIGPTITTSPMRLVLDRNTSVEKYLRTVQEQASVALSFQFAGLQHIRKLSSDAAVACEFQSLLVIAAGDDMKDPDGGLWNLQSTGTVGTNFFNYALVFNCRVEKNSIHIEVNYDSKVISTWLVQCMLRQFDYILTQFNSPEMSGYTLRELQLLNPDDEKIISGLNHQPLNTIDKCIHNVIYQDQVILRPLSIALDAWDTGIITYRELDERATRLAVRLIASDVKPGSFVPLCFDKCGWFIISMLAILKAGAAFVPLDPEAPLQRLQDIVGDLKPELILCDPKFEALCQSIPCKFLAIDRDADEGQSGHLHALPYVQSDATAYVLFTSGTTGKPKGAVISHSAWVSSSTRFAPALGITESSRVLQYCSYTFDVSLAEILSTLMVGGTVCVPDHYSRTNDLAGVINKFKVDCVFITPSVVRTIQPSQVPQLKELILAGEAMSQQDLVTWADRLVLRNGYGPTECAAFATANVMTSTTKPNNLGKGVSGRGWIVLKDDHNVLVPFGAIGELLLEGGCVGSGYLNNPEKTNEVFVSNLSWTLGADTLDGPNMRRFYKTGDLVKYNEDGTMMYLGRKDLQTKVRGQRLELSEVEHHLMDDALVQNSLAAVPSTGHCAKRLVAVISLQNISVACTQEIQLLPAETANFNIGTIRDRLCERLPSYMVPVVWVAIASFPLMPSGKMDRRRIMQWLDRMDQDIYRSIVGSKLEATHAKSNDIEGKIQAIFANILNLPPGEVGLNQSFLHLGGDSISAMQVVSQCRLQGLLVSVQELIRAKSIAALASTVAIAEKGDASKPQTEGYDLPFDLTPIQKVFFDTVADEYNYWNQSVVLRLARNFDSTEIEAALKSLVDTHPMLRGRYVRDESRVWHQKIERQVEKSFRLRHHRVSTGKNDSLQPIIDESQRTLDITNGPTFSVDLFDMDDSFTQAIALVAHHLVIDVVSWGIIIEDLHNLLSGVIPPSQSTPFYDWTQQQAEQARRESARRVLPLASVPPADLEYWGMDGQSNVNGDIITEDIELSPRDSMLLLGAHDALQTKPLDFFIAALLESFRKVFPDRPTVTIHNEGHGREPFDSKQDLSRTIGWFTSLTPIHLPIPPEEPTDIIGTIRWVKDLRERIPDNGRPYFAYRHLTQEGQQRFAGHWPAEVTFNYLGRMQNLERKGVLLQKMDGILTSDIGDNVPRLSLFEVTALVSQGTIKLSFCFNRHMKRQPDIKRWISECRQTLIDGVDQLLQARPEPSLSGFKLLPLSYNGMTKLSEILPSGTALDDIEDIYPASPMQQGMLLSQMKNPELYAYHCIFEVRSTDPHCLVDPRKIAEAWQVVVQRHSALRTVFIESLSKTTLMDQVVFKDRSGRISWLMDCPDSEVAEMLRAQPTVDYREFNTAHRLTIAKTTSKKIWVKMELNHAVVDGGSVPNLLNDIARAYQGKITRSDAGMLYSDFIAHLTSNSRDADVNYWKAYLSGAESCFFPNLNDGKPGPHEVADHTIDLPDTSILQAFCKRNGVTLSTFLQLCWALALHLYVGSSDVCFGVVASGRDVPVRNIEEAVGCFVNMIICRLTFSDETSISQLLESLQKDSTDAMVHQNCSLADVQHELHLPALFNTVFTLQRRHLTRDPSKTALTFDNVEAADPGEYHITINVDVTDEGVKVDFGYWKDKIHESQMLNVAEAFTKVINSIVTSPGDDLTVGDIDFSTAGSVAQILDWNRELPPPTRRCIHDLISEQALLKPPSSMAVEGWDGSFSYQEFDEITTRLAAHLQAMGVTTETFVPILTEKSSWAIVSMIAIMKAGGAYVPLDPKHPLSRLRQLVSDVRANIVLCSRAFHTRASEIAPNAVVVDRPSVDGFIVAKGTKLRSDVTPDNAAYCIFTSGTTGKPKGTIIPHQAFSTSAHAFGRAMSILPESRIYQFASYTFDASCAEILASLIIGATVCVSSEEERMNDPAGAIRKFKATWALLTPSVLGAIKPKSVPTIRTIVSGGEAITNAVLDQWGTTTNLVNAYGPTEGSVASVLDRKSTFDGKILNTDPSTIGYPSGCRLWIVHPRNHHKLMPIGSVGELLIEGYIVGRGYLGDEVKTSQAFIANPAWTSTLSPSQHGTFFTTRMYKTGDLARYNTDGSVSYMGRKDTQIKLNGQRIELGEIEYHVKSKFPEGFQSAVELVAPSGRKTLAVFFCTIDKDAVDSVGSIQPASVEFPTADEILLSMNDNMQGLSKTVENDLASVLPTYMIPSIFIPLSEMPVNAATKLDRNRLRNMVQNLTKEAMSPYRLANAMHKKKPTTTAERKLQKLFCSVLNLKPTAVGRDDSFIRLGGDSVAAMKLVAAAEAENLNITVASLFMTPKLSDLAANCTSSGRTSKAIERYERFKLIRKPLSVSDVLGELSQQCRIPKNKIQDAYPASPLQQAFVTLSIKQPGAYVAQHVLNLSESIDETRFKAAWEKAVQDIDILRTRIAQTESGAFLQTVLVEDPITWHETSALDTAAEAAMKIPLHLGAPLAAYTLVRTSDNKRYFVWTIHHALFDGWSIPFMLQRVEKIYKKGTSDIQKIPYTRFIEYLIDSKPESSTKFWKESLAGASPYQFPQRPHSIQDKAPSGKILSHTAKLAPHRHQDITIPTIVRAAWALLIASYTGNGDVVFGETLTGRDITVPGISDICGPTLTTVPTRVRVNQSASVLSLLQDISRNAADRIQHQHLGVSEIKRIDQDTAAACDFQNLLAIQTGVEGPSESMWSFHDQGEQANYFTYPLVIECKVDKSTVNITAHYDEDTLSTWHTHRLLYQFESILNQMSVAGTVKDIQVVSEQDIQLVRQWNSREPVMVDETIHSLFLKQVHAQPNAIAVSAFDGEFTYGELRDLASRLSQELIRLGAGPEKLVPICADKSRWAVVAIMGVLLSGAGYVPLSPEHPITRHRQIILDCNASILLCSPSYEERFTSLISPVITISEQSLLKLPARQDVALSRTKSNNICYVLYTSGSTGAPKGVVIEHRAIASSSAAICKALHMKPTSRVFQFGSFVFDASVMEILTTLTCGATICIPSEQDRTTDIASAINKLRATWTCLTPSVANVIESPEAVPTLQTFASGAEALTSETINKWVPGLQLLNAYGPTEGSVVAVANDQVATQRDPSTIGRMLQSGRAWILNPDNPNQLAPVGAVGELCIEGALLARGYLNNHAKTAEAFVDNPIFMKELLPSVSSSRIYRTGDLVQYAPDGAIRYIGRKDNQVKLAGQRMELGEIEHHLQADKSIRQAVVLMPKSGPGKRKLTGVVTFHNLPAEVTGNEEAWGTVLGNPEILRQIDAAKSRLSDLVPSYMVPTVWVALPRIPALASAKLDRKQVTFWLEGMEDEAYRQILELEASSEPAVPTTETAAKLHGIWAKVLNLPAAKVKMNKSWLAQGGDSITAMQLLARCRKEGINLTLNQVLRAKSITHLALTVMSDSSFFTGEEQTDKPFALSPVQRFYFDSIGDENNSHFNQSSTLQFSRSVDLDSLKEAIDAIVKCHSMLRARFSKDTAGTWQQSILSHASDTYKLKTHSISITSEIVDIISETQKSLDIIRGPVFAVDLFTIASGGQAIFLTAHHLVIDVVSWKVVLGDLEDYLNSSSTKSLQGELSFQVWSEKQASHANLPIQIEAAKKHQFTFEPADVAFWGLDKRLNIYGDVDRDSFFMDEEITSMAFESNALRTNVVDIFVAAIIHSFSRVFLNRSMPTVFIENHGREPWESSNLDLSRTVGWFTTMYPVHIPIAEDQDDIIHTLRQVKDNRSKVVDNGRPYYAHRYLTEDGRQRYANHEPMEILFNYLGKNQQLEADDALFKPIQFTEDEDAEMSDLGAKTKRSALFEISASVNNDQIEFTFMYNRWMKNQKSIRRWIAECQRTFEEAVTSLTKVKKPLPTLGDFPLLQIDSYDRLDRLLKTLPRNGVASYDQVEDIYPCAAMQVGMLLSQSKDPKSYWSFTTFEVKAIRGRVDVRKLAASWQQVVNRHSSLRTVFVDSVCKGGIFDQMVVKAPDSGLLTISCDDSELSTKLDAIRYHKFNGKKKLKLPHQFTIVQTNTGKVVIKLEINHSVIDGGSYAILVKDLEAAYEGRLDIGEGPRYIDYIKYLKNLPPGEALEYWKQQLHGVQPCYFPSTPQHSSKQRELHSHYLEFDHFNELHSLATRNGASLANILLAAWSLILSTYTGSNDVCYGYLTSGRNVPIDGIEEAVGAFINMLVLRTKITRTSPIIDVIHKVQNDFIESLPHQHCSLAEFQHSLGLSGKALFNTVVSVQNSGVSQDTNEQKSSIALEPISGHDPSEYAITVNIDVSREEPIVRFAYWTDSVSDIEVKDMSSKMSTVLNQMIADATRTVAELNRAVEVDMWQSKPIVAAPRSDAADPPHSLPSISETQPNSLSVPLVQAAAPDMGSLVRSIISEMVPQLVEQLLSNNKSAVPRPSTMNEMANQMANMVSRKASQSIRGGRPSFDQGSLRREGSIRSRRMSVVSFAESLKPSVAADMVATAEAIATEAVNAAADGTNDESRGSVEKKLLTLWSELLDMVEDSIGDEDSFFQLGGDSIIAMRLVGAAREEGLTITVADVFKNPNFADMARVVQTAGAVIDQVMSQAGDEVPIPEASAGVTQRPPTLERSNSVLSAIRDFQSIASSQANGHHENGEAKPSQELTQEQSEQMFRRWNGFTQDREPATQPTQPSQRLSFRKSIAEPAQQLNSGNHKSISLLGDPNVDSVISKVQVFKGGISDVIPCTDFQSLAITGTLLESKWMLNYFYLSGRGPLDLRKLKHTIFRTVQSYDILRTVFVPYGDRFLQVILRKLQPDFIYQETDLNLDNFTEELRRKDREHGPKLGETFLQFVVAKQKGTDDYRIVIRLSHAQYDGFCLPLILQALSNGYNGLPIAPSPPFGNYVRESAKTIAGAYDHWREVLRGSKMTEIVNRYGPNYQRSGGLTVTLKQTLTVPTLSHLNITAATVMKAAWASTLAQITSTSDIIFGHVISGRNSGVPNIENIVGPCLNMVPVRVVYRSEWTVLDLLRYIQEQQIANMEYESLGFRDITRNCTDWPDWTNFSSVIQHNQNMLDKEATLQLGGIEYTLGSSGSQEDFADFSILSASKGGDQLEVMLTYAPNNTITADYAQHVFDTLCTTVITFAEDPHTFLPSPDELTSQISAIPTSEKSKAPGKRSSEKQVPALPTDTGLSTHELNTLATRLRTAWERILHDNHGIPLAMDLDSDFFDLGGDIMGLAQMASMLDQEGLHVRVEDLLDKPVFADQVGVLAIDRKKQIEREAANEARPWGEKGRTNGASKDGEAAAAAAESPVTSPLGFSGFARKIGLKRRDTPKK